jgi:hypothetical protein
MVKEQRRGTGNNPSFRGIAGIGDEPGICSWHVGSNGGHNGSQTSLPAIVVAAQKADSGFCASRCDAQPRNDGGDMKRVEEPSRGTR